MLQRSGMHQVLLSLSEQLEMVTQAAYELVVCGGAALQALGFVDRTTRDVDVLAIADGMLPTLLSADPLPEAIITAAHLVARDYNLQADWLNGGPTDLLSQGLPEGLTSRWHTVRYGKLLTVHFIGRIDQICFKTYAAINGGADRHLSDLLVLNPTDDEMLLAARWCLTQDASEVFPQIAKSFLKKVGWNHIAELV